MRMVPLDQVEPGMVAATDILDRRGRVLVPSGAELSQRTIDALGNWGIEAVNIESDEPARVIDPIELEEAKEAIAWRFAKTTPDHPLIEALIEEAARAKIRQQATAPHPQSAAAHES